VADIGEVRAFGRAYSKGAFRGCSSEGGRSRCWRSRWGRSGLPGSRAGGYTVTTTAESTITLPTGTYTLTSPSTGADDPTTGDLDIKRSVTIVGAGSGSTVINANQIDRAFAVQPNASLSLPAMTIENGLPSSNSTGNQLGGASYDAGTLDLIGDVTLTKNEAQNSGGAIFVVGNTAGMSGGGVVPDSMNSTGPDVVNQDEFDDNTAAGGNPPSGWAGGLGFGANAPLDSSGWSFIGNSAVQFGGGVDISGGRPVSLVNATITATGLLPAAGSSGVTGNVCPGWRAKTEDGKDAGGNNLDGDRSCFQGDAASDKVGVANPLLGQPADNGGPVLTDRLEIGSPAIDGGTDVDCPATDARGVPRPQGASCDIGAYEFAPASLSLANSAPATAATGVPFDETITVSQAGAGPSTVTTVSDQLPPNAGLYGVSPSQGSCSSTASPSTISCETARSHPVGSPRRTSSSTGRAARTGPSLRSCTPRHPRRTSRSRSRA
jgi:predicted outer membrane repeat protein